MRMRHTWATAWGTAVVALASTLITSAPAHADLGFQFDATTLQFIYDHAPGPDGLVGHIEVTDSVASGLTVGAYDLGANRLFGGGDDQLVDLAKINSSTLFATSLLADVHRLGPGLYDIDGTIAVTDLSGATVLEGAFSSTHIVSMGGLFYFTGDLSNPDGLLVSDDPDAWLFNGVAEDSPDDILGTADYGIDGTDGTVRLDAGRSNYRSGNLVDFQFTGYYGDLEGFFSRDRYSYNSNMKIQAVPAHGALALGAAGMGLIGLIRRRMAM